VLGPAGESLLDRAAAEAGGPAPVPASLRHRLVVVADADAEVLAAVEAEAWLVNEAMRLALLARIASAEVDAATGRAVVFVASEEQAERVAAVLRSRMAGGQAILALLPSRGSAPLLVADGGVQRATPAAAGLDAIVAAGGGWVLVAPAEASRGLDLKGVGSVYLFGVQPAAADYARVAGRAGRVGQAERGTVTTIVSSGDEAAALRRVVEGELMCEVEEVGAEVWG